MSGGRPMSSVGKVILDFMQFDLTNRQIAEKVQQHFRDTTFDPVKLTQRIANARYMSRRRARIVEQATKEVIEQSNG